MLARFVCPASRLGGLAPHVDELFQTGPALRLTLLGRGGDTSEQFLERLQSDLRDMAEFRALHPERTAIETFEVRLPGDLSTDGDVVQLMNSVSELWVSHGVGGLPVFFEPARTVDWQSTWSSIIRGLAQHGTSSGGNSDAQGMLWRGGFKLRCGGVDAAAVPTVEQVASAIWWARSARVPMKFTAGLHHPLRHHDEALHADVHGFINVFTAGVLAGADHVNEEHLRRILESKDAASFEFSADSMAWRGIRVTCREIAEARRLGVTSFGSCSFDEPREDLRRLGLL